MMRTRLICGSVWLVATFVAAAFVLFGEPPASADQDFPMICRGGRYLVRYFYFGGTTGLVIQMAAKGTQGVANDFGVLEAGQCSWLDRAFRADEPDMLCAKPFQFALNGATSGGGALVGLQTDKPAIDFARLADPTRYTSFQVHNDGTCFQVSSSVGVVPMRRMPIPAIAAPSPRT